jgi:hypothetical protein
MGLCSAEGYSDFGSGRLGVPKSRLSTSIWLSSTILGEQHGSRLNV